MSHRKFEHPRCGSLGFRPRKRCRRGKGTIRHFPKDDNTKHCHLTAFMGYKSGMTHVVREISGHGSKIVKKEICEPVTVIETPPMIAVGIIGYEKTPKGLRIIRTIFAKHLSNEFRRTFYKNWYKSKGKAFTKYAKKYASNNEVTKYENNLEYIKKQCSIVRILCHTQVNKIQNLKQKKSHLLEIQINGGSISDKIDFGFALIEKKTFTFDSVFAPNGSVDVISITKGKGTQGVISRFGVTRLPRKTHRGLRKVACVGAWHPSAVKWTVARAGQKGYHHRTEMNKKIIRIGKADKESKKASTDFDLTDKTITPLGGFPHYGIVKEDYVILKGSVPGPVRRVITFRDCLFPQANRKAMDSVNLKFIDTSSKFGQGRFQTTEEKRKVMGQLKI